MDASMLCLLGIASTQKEYLSTFHFGDATTPCQSQWHISVISENSQGNPLFILEAKEKNKRTLPAPSRKIMRQYWRYPPILEISANIGDIRQSEGQQ
jgi:hypothetical protein